MATIMKRIQISNTEMLEPQNVLEGSSYSLGKVGKRDFWEKSLQDLISHWNLLLLSAPLSFLVFLVTMALMSQATRATLIIVVVIMTVTAMMHITILSLHESENLKNLRKNLQSQMRGVFENRTNQYLRLFLIVSSITAVTVTLLSAAYCLFVRGQQKSFCSTKKSACIISIGDVGKKVTKKKPLLLIPIISAALQILALSSSLSASISLTTGKAPQFRVVDSCHEELCVSNDTKAFFQEGDLCSPEEFRWAENTSI